MTTERILPAIALPVPGRQRPIVPGARAEAPARAVTRRREALLTTPARAGMLIGASAAIYAVTLAGVAGLQAGTDAELVARHQPYLNDLARTRAANDQLEVTVARADAQLQALGGIYARTGDAVTAYETRLDALAKLVAEVQGSAAALPSRLSLPAVSVRSSVGSTAPATTAKTGASGAP